MCCACPKSENYKNFCATMYSIQYMQCGFFLSALMSTHYSILYGKCCITSIKNGDDEYERAGALYKSIIIDCICSGDEKETYSPNHRNWANIIWLKHNEQPKGFGLVQNGYCNRINVTNSSLAAELLKFYLVKETLARIKRKENSLKLRFIE